MAQLFRTFSDNLELLSPFPGCELQQVSLYFMDMAGIDIFHLIDTSFSENISVLMMWLKRYGTLCMLSNQIEGLFPLFDITAVAFYRGCLAPDQIAPCSLVSLFTFFQASHFTALKLS